MTDKTDATPYCTDCEHETVVADHGHGERCCDCGGGRWFYMAVDMAAETTKPAPDGTGQ